jgi:hypothetical protein
VKGARLLGAKLTIAKKSIGHAGARRRGRHRATAPPTDDTTSGGRSVRLSGCQCGGNFKTRLAASTGPAGHYYWRSALVMIATINIIMAVITDRAHYTRGATRSAVGARGDPAIRLGPASVLISGAQVGDGSGGAEPSPGEL